MHDDMGGVWERPWVELTPGERVAGFIIEGKLASGSFGTVFKASRDGRRFAVKLVPMDKRGNREVDALRRAQLPNVVSFHGYSVWPDEEPRFLVLALELIEGRSLDVWAREENPSALELVHQVLVPLASTLADVHAAGVVHRDVKETNIIIREADGQPVLVDFGAAAYEGAPRLTMRLPPGTPEYRSPEALRFARAWEGEPYPGGPGDDLWALGVAIYGLLTRELPFGDRHDQGMVRAILEQAPSAPHVLNPRVPPALGELCLRMLEKAPEARFADAQALEAALEDAAAQADDVWRAPLFPGGRQEKRPASALASPPAQPLVPAPTPSPPSEIRARPVRRWWPWAAGLVLGTAVGMGLMVLTPRTTSPTTPPPQQAVPRQEIAPVDLTEEVGPGAAPQTSPTPAPVARATRSENSAMTKSQKIRSLAAATCLVGSACASGPQQRPPPKPAECPPGAAATLEQFRIREGETHITYFPAFSKTRVAIVREGPITVEQPVSWGLFPDSTRFMGHVFFGAGRVYGRFTQAILPNGESVPVCLEWLSPNELGIKMKPESTAEEAHIIYDPRIQAVSRFH
ncbi:protein kinase [Archangium minus]|uniref:Protein kinase n=1 Tax=Archangium minus TaxID=83450 RepID=A0ABY9WK91_9BACT|nr:protein kinase [Archangium minus]